jgi:hypothetical protein
VILDGVFLTSIPSESRFGRFIDQLTKSDAQLRVLAARLAATHSNDTILLFRMRWCFAVSILSGVKRLT